MDLPQLSYLAKMLAVSILVFSSRDLSEKFHVAGANKYSTEWYLQNLRATWESKHNIINLKFHLLHEYNSYH